MFDDGVLVQEYQVFLPKSAGVERRAIEVAEES
jgi:hypothetical protein